jgi:regulatory protein
MGALFDHSSFLCRRSERQVGGRITSLRFQKHSSDRVNVYLDDRFAFGLPAVEAARLRVGQTLDDLEIAGLRSLDVEQKAYDRAVRFLAYRPRSEAEVRKRLERSDTDPDVIEAVIERLKAQSYLDDAEFARFWVEGRQRFRPRSAVVLRQELRRKGLDDSTIAPAVAELDALAAAIEAGRPRALRMAGLAGSDPILFRRKMSDFLLRRGFDYDVVREVVALLMGELAGGEAPTDSTD